MTGKLINQLLGGQIDAIADGDEFVVRDVSEVSGYKTKYALATQIATYAASNITSLSISQVSGLQLALDAKQPLDADLTAIAAFSSTGIPARTATNTWAQRTITGTANEITLTNGDGVSGNPTVSLPAALTFTGKTVTGGTFANPTINTITKINLNGSSLPTPISGAALQIGQADNTTTTLELDSFNRSSIVAGQRTDGAAATPLAIQAGSEPLFSLHARGYDGTAYGIGAAINFVAATGWSNTSHAGLINFQTCAVGSTTLVTHLLLDQDGGLWLGNPTGGSEGFGTLNLAGNLYNNGTAPTGTGGYVRANSPALATPDLGTPSAVVLTNATGTASNLTAGHVTTNANLTGVITSVGNATSIASQTGTGTKFVVDTSPTLVTPVLGVATATSINGNTFTTGTYTLTGTAGKTFTFSNTLTFAGTDSTTITFPSTSATVARTDAANTFTGHQTIEGVTSTGATGTGKFVFDTSPVLVTPNLGTPSAVVLTNASGTAGSLTAGNVTTNANLTGQVTSVGNAATLDKTAITAQTLNNSPVAANDYITYYSASNNALQKATITNLISSGTAGVTTFNSRSGAVTPTSGDYSVAQVTGAAPLASPTFTGTPAAPTASAANNSTQIATTAYVDAADNLHALIASPTFTGTPAAPTPAFGTNTTQLATTAFVVAQIPAGAICATYANFGGF